jgi:hypothetical protein
MARKHNEARSLSTEGGTPSPITHRRPLRSKPDAVKSETTAVDAAVTEAPVAPTTAPISEREEIAKLAYGYWLERGGQHGSPEQDWLRAEKEFRRRRQESAS